MIDITRNAVWTEDCCGKMDLDFPFIGCDTRYWPDNTCKCHFRLCGGIYLDIEHEWHEPFDEISLLQSDYIKGNSKEDCQMKARQWYNEHAVQALKLAILKLEEEEYVMNKRFILPTILFILFVTQFICLNFCVQEYGWNAWLYVLLATTFLTLGGFVGLFVSWWNN